MPGLIHGKRPVSLGQLEEQLKKVVGAFPITAFPDNLYQSKFEKINSDMVELHPEFPLNLQLKEWKSEA